MTNQPTFSVASYLQNRWKITGRIMAFSARTAAEIPEWRAALRGELRRVTGYYTMQRAPLAPQITEEMEFDDFMRQKVVIQTEPDVWMPFYVLIPKKGQAPFPVVLAPHGHGLGGKMGIIGDRTRPEVAKAIDFYNGAYGLDLVRAGFIVFCPDARGFGERMEPQIVAQKNFLLSSCEVINHMAYPLGQTITGMWAWDLHRLIDYVETRSDCQSNRIGCAGLSGGGLQTLWASALDERIQCAVISGYFYGYKESLLDLPQNCSCNYVPYLYQIADMGDIGALIAPRPVLIESGTRDHLNGINGISNVISQVNILKQAYTLLGAPQNVKHDIFEGEHRWHGVEAIPWLQSHLM